MNILIDTHIAVWAVSDNELLSLRADQMITNTDNNILVSVVSIWEIAIKFALRRGTPRDMPISGYTALERFEEAGFELLPIEVNHVAAVADLPHHHSDPFDRLLVAQAQSERFTLLTHDRRLPAYGDFVTLA